MRTLSGPESGRGEAPGGSYWRCWSPATATIASVQGLRVRKEQQRPRAAAAGAAERAANRPSSGKGRNRAAACCGLFAGRISVTEPQAVDIPGGQARLYPRPRARSAPLRPGPASRSAAIYYNRLRREERGRGEPPDHFRPSTAGPGCGPRPYLTVGTRRSRALPSSSANDPRVRQNCRDNPQDPGSLSRTW